MALHFHPLAVKRVTPDAAGSAAITFQVPPELADDYAFRPGQFLTLRATLEGREVRRNYSICSSAQQYRASGEIDVGIKPMEGGLFSRWAVQTLRPGSVIDVMPPDGRFSPRAPGARHRVGFAAGSGITPILSIMATTLHSEPESSFTLVYCNQRSNTIMFNEALQDLKDRYPARLTLIHLLSRQPQEATLLNGRLDEAKVAELLDLLIPPPTIDEAFVCGPEAMIDGTERALKAAGVPADRIHAERFVPPGGAEPTRPRADPAARAMSGHAHQLDIVLDAGLDLPYSCKGGVCCTCRAKVVEGRVEMEKNYTLEPWEIEKGFVLTCQSRPLTEKVVVSYDER